MTRVVGIGAGGHAKVIVDALQLRKEVEIVGLLEADPRRHGTDVLGVTVLGGDEFLPKLSAQGVTHFFIGVGSVGDATARARLFALGVRSGLTPLTVIHPAAVVSPAARLGGGVSVLAGVTINAGAQLGDNVIVNTGAIVEHDCMIGDHAHVATGACLAGNVTVGAGAHVGIGAAVRQGIRIGQRAVVGAGAAVVADVPDGVVVAGVPARFLKQTSP